MYTSNTLHNEVVDVAMSLTGRLMHTQPVAGTGYNKKNLAGIL